MSYDLTIKTVINFEVDLQTLKLNIGNVLFHTARSLVNRRR